MDSNSQVSSLDCTSHICFWMLYWKSNACRLSFNTFTKPTFQAQQCASNSCVKQIFGMDTVSFSTDVSNTISYLGVKFECKSSFTAVSWMDTRLPAEENFRTCRIHWKTMFQVRYCDGTGVQSVCKAYKVSNTCEMVPNVGYICCCDSELCNPARQLRYSLLFSLIPVIMFLL